MDRVASIAGVSKATVYSHFGDKEGLFKSLVESMAKQRMQAIMSKLELDLPPRECLRTVFRYAVEDCYDNPEFHNFKRVLVGEAGRFPELAKTFIEHLSKPGIEVLTQYLQDSPAFDFLDPEAIARIVIGAMMHFVLVQKIVHGEDVVPMDVDRIIAGLECLLFPKG